MLNGRVGSVLVVKQHEHCQRVVHELDKADTEWFCPAVGEGELRRTNDISTLQPVRNWRWRTGPAPTYLHICRFGLVDEILHENAI